MAVQVSAGRVRAWTAVAAQRLAALFGPLLAAIENGKLLLVDEFDLSLHPLVARYLGDAAPYIPLAIAVIQSFIATLPRQNRTRLAHG